ncbi:hypothetical protein IF1G_07352 [Cordyceps javanica]|uniref:Uncharacterized protein n=1 Tax=Cordyceps javanica TaxID=43265 RepID=A0A545UVX5_9HYPO|nr:hypothetical protein IF1G_07352 [Cordyceps javanica]
MLCSRRGGLDFITTQRWSKYTTPRTGRTPSSMLCTFGGHQGLRLSKESLCIQVKRESSSAHFRQLLTVKYTDTSGKQIGLLVRWRALE